jgi:hypothetical protein
VEGKAGGGAQEYRAIDQHDDTGKFFWGNNSKLASYEYLFLELCKGECEGEKRTERVLT